MTQILQIENLTDSPNQRHTIELKTSSVVIVLHYHPQIEQWTIDAEAGSKSVYGAKLATGVRHIKSRNAGIDFAVICEGDIDPFQVDDFSSGRCVLLMEVDDAL